MINQYVNKSFEQHDEDIKLFYWQIQTLRERAVSTYSLLNDKSKIYSQNDTGGIVCSYALNKSFQHLTAIDILNKSEQYSQMVETFQTLINFKGYAL